MFLVKINLPPVYSPLLLLVRAFFSLPPFSTFSIPPTPFFLPLLTPSTLLTVYSDTVGGVEGDGAQMDEEKKRFRGDSEITLTLVLCCSKSLLLVH